MSDKYQNWTTHLGELRIRIMVVLAIFVVTLGIGFYYAQPIIDWVIHDILSGTLKRRVELHVFSPGESLSIYMQFAFLLAVIFTLPVGLYQLWRFVSPGLTVKEQRATLRYIPLAVLLFTGGLVFAYYLIIPFILHFMTILTSRLGAQETYGMYEFFRFIFRILFPVALLFELPVIILFLTRLRILNPDLLRRGRRYAWLAMVILSSLITPPDFISNILVSIPLILLYEASIFLAVRVAKQMAIEDAAQEREWREEDQQEWGSSFDG
ncbi:twin-arginine translocase subunit TatC [Marininema halotolerans]|uniref:Sec-independent protein translocase protein TatC n=1 Tax=Marininema halotolerans TaxID=1155944 RepID=A0A1I6TMW1_9BACL|nr:twin-arginine translocase subunit TatC [Marininema halotolerans]SFS90592.1 sec-independent protein translocase protein TatC [Marininema halotolerans]